MDLTHIHLLLNHFPTIGTIIGVGLFLISLLGKSNDLKRASLVIFFGICMLTIPTYISGNAAAQKICIGPAAGPCQDATVSKVMIASHEGVALVAFFIMQVLGFFAWLGLWQIRRFSHLPNWNLVLILILCAASLGFVSKAANLGGEIRHPEIRDAQVTGPEAQPLGRQLGAWVIGQKWVWPTCETLHFIGLSLLFGVSALVDLRMLGLMRNVPFPAIHRLLPWGILGFGINMITGMLFFVGAPEQYTTNPVFHWKIALMMLAAINVLYFTIFDEAWVLGPGDDAPSTAKAVAFSALVLVIGVLFCGRMLPFLGNAF
jgi:hypothetical protein